MAPPDLAVSAVSFSPTEVWAGRKLSVTFTVQNQGGSASGPFFNGVILSPSIWGAGLHWLGQSPMDSLEPGASRTVTVTTAPVPATTYPAAYWVNVIADNQGNVRDSDRLNNEGSSASSKVTVRRKGFFKDERVRTTGDEPLRGGPALAHWGRTAPKGTWCTASGGKKITGVDYSSVQADGYTWWPVVSCLYDPSYGHGWNDGWMREERLELPPPPDLAVTLVSFSPSQLREHDKISVTFTVENLGGTTTYDRSGSFFARVHLVSTGFSYDLVRGVRTGQGQLWGRHSVEYPKPGRPRTVTIEQSAIHPRRLSPGTYWVVVAIDYVEAGTGELQDRDLNIDNDLAAAPTPLTILPMSQ